MSRFVKVRLLVAFVAITTIAASASCASAAIWTIPGADSKNLNYPTLVRVDNSKPQPSFVVADSPGGETNRIMRFSGDGSAEVILDVGANERVIDLAVAPDGDIFYVKRDDWGDSSTLNVVTPKIPGRSLGGSSYDRRVAITVKGSRVDMYAGSVAFDSKGQLHVTNVYGRGVSRMFPVSLGVWKLSPSHERLNMWVGELVAGGGTDNTDSVLHRALNVELENVQNLTPTSDGGFMLFNRAQHQNHSRSESRLIRLYRREPTEKRQRKDLGIQVVTPPKGFEFRTIDGMVEDHGGTILISTEGTMLRLSYQGWSTPISGVVAGESTESLINSAGIARAPHAGIVFVDPKNGSLRFIGPQVGDQRLLTMLQNGKRELVKSILEQMRAGISSTEAAATNATAGHATTQDISGESTRHRTWLLALRARMALDLLAKQT